MSQTKKTDIIFTKAPDRKKILNIIMRVRTDMAVFASLPKDRGFRSKAPSHEENGVWIGAWPAV
jgi:hypothetical protein